MAIFGAKKTTKEEDKKKAAKPEAKAAKKKETVKKEKAATMQDLYAGGETAVKTATAKTAQSSKHDVSYRVLVKPLITEKATNLVSENKYVFVVSANANKIEVARAINTLYGIKPLRVNLANVKGKKVTRGRIKGQRSDWRKAIVTLAKGQTIKIYEGV